MSAKVAFVGLGVMGYPMAGHLQRAGYDVTVFNRTVHKAESWCKAYGGTMAKTPAEAAVNAEFVFCCVGNDDDLRQVILGEEGVLHGVSSNTYVVDHTTASATIARELAEILNQKDVHFLDAPVSGGEAGAVNGALSVMVGGLATDFDRVLPLLQIYGKAVTLIGPHGSGQLCKMVNQICIGGLVQALSEALSFGVNAGLDMEKVLSVIANGAAQSWQMENRSNTMLQHQYNHGFAVDWMRKDFAIVFEEARKNGSSLPITALVDQFYADVQTMGGGRWDTSSLMARLQQVSK